LIRWLWPATPVPPQALQIPFLERLQQLSGSSQTPRFKTQQLAFLLALVCWTLLVGAATRPQWVGEPISLPVSGRSLMLAVDLSGSMKEEDLQLSGNPTNRLNVVKNVLQEFITRRDGDRLGLILFGEQAYLQTPLTFDRKTVQQMLLESEIGLAGERTAIGNAIGLGVKRLQGLEESERVLILLTDGANTAGDISPEQAARLAEQAGVRIYTIGVGADEMLVQTFLVRDGLIHHAIWMRSCCRRLLLSLVGSISEPAVPRNWLRSTNFWMNWSLWRETQTFFDH
jgi:Ca-activated chloride channel family protein